MALASATDLDRDERIWSVERRKPVRLTAPGTVDLPLSTEGKRTLLLAAEEADRLSSKKIRTDHLLLGLLRNECLAAALLHGRGLDLDSTGEELGRNPHDDSAKETFVRELGYFLKT